MTYGPIQEFKFFTSWDASFSLWIKLEAFIDWCPDIESNGITTKVYVFNTTIIKSRAYFSSNAYKKFLTSEMEYMYNVGKFKIKTKCFPLICVSLYEKEIFLSTKNISNVPLKDISVTSSMISLVINQMKL